MRGSVRGAAADGRRYSRPSVRPARSRRHHRDRAVDRRTSTRPSAAVRCGLRPRPVPPPRRGGGLARRRRRPGRPLRRRLDRSTTTRSRSASTGSATGPASSGSWPPARRTPPSSWPARSRPSTSTSSTRRTRSSSSRRSRSCPTRSTTSSGIAIPIAIFCYLLRDLPWWAWPARRAPLDDELAPVPDPQRQQLALHDRDLRARHPVRLGRSGCWR